MTTEQEVNEYHSCEERHCPCCFVVGLYDAENKTLEDWTATGTGDETICMDPAATHWTATWTSNGQKNMAAISMPLCAEHAAVMDGLALLTGELE